MDWIFFNKGLIHILGLEPNKDPQHAEIMREIGKLEEHCRTLEEQTLNDVIKSKDKLIMELAEKNQIYHDNIKAYKKLLGEK